MSQKTRVRNIVRVVESGMVTASEGVIMLAELSGVDARCAMGECYHGTEGDRDGQG